MNVASSTGDWGLVPLDFPMYIIRYIENPHRNETKIKEWLNSHRTEVDNWIKTTSDWDSPYNFLEKTKMDDLTKIRLVSKLQWTKIYEMFYDKVIYSPTDETAPIAQLTTRDLKTQNVRLITAGGRNRKRRYQYRGKKSRSRR